MSNEYDFQKVCRTCLSGTNLKCLYDKCTSQDCFNDMLMICTPMKYYKDDGLPLQICVDCISELKQSYKFALKCQESDTKLRIYIQKLVPQEYAIPQSANSFKATNIMQDSLETELIILKSEPENTMEYLFNTDDEESLINDVKLENTSNSPENTLLQQTTTQGYKPLKRRKESSLIKKKRGPVKPIPVGVRTDNLGHWPTECKTRTRCKKPSCGLKTFFKCSKCELNLCIKKTRNCFIDFHK